MYRNIYIRLIVIIYRNIDLLLIVTIGIETCITFKMLLTIKSCSCC